MTSMMPIITHPSPNACPFTDRSQAHRLQRTHIVHPRSIPLQQEHDANAQSKDKSFSLRVSKDARFQFGYSGPLIPTNRRLSIFAARLSENLTDEDDSAAATADPSDVSTADERLQ